MEEVPHWWKNLPFTGAPETKVTGKRTKSSIPDRGWQEQASDEERATATLNYAKWQDQMRGFFKDNPQAKSEEAEKFSQSILAPHVEKQVKQQLAPVNPVDAQAKAWAREHPNDPRAKKILDKLGP